MILTKPQAVSGANPQTGAKPEPCMGRPRTGAGSGPETDWASPFASLQHGPTQGLMRWEVWLLSLGTREVSDPAPPRSSCPQPSPLSQGPNQDIQPPEVPWAPETQPAQNHTLRQPRLGLQDQGTEGALAQSQVGLGPNTLWATLIGAAPRRCGSIHRNGDKCPGRR